VLFRDFFHLKADIHEGKALPFLKKDCLNFMADQKDSTKLRVNINATQSGYLLNRRVYPGRFVKDKSVWGTWCDEKHGGCAPYNKPILTHHNHHGEPIGRVVAAEFVQHWDDQRLQKDYQNPATGDDNGSGTVQVVGMITDSEAIQKILDGRYNTVSTGQNSNHAYCSICGQDWKQDGICEHRPGKHYEEDSDEDVGRLCYIITGPLNYRELSYVNIPANVNAVTVGAELSDELGEFAAELGDAELAQQEGGLAYSTVDIDSYAGISCIDSEGNETDLIRSEDGDESLPRTRTQIVMSKLDLDDMKPPEVVFPDSNDEELDAETFAIGNITRSLADQDLLGDSPLGGMVTWFKAITGKSGKPAHQHILYLELDVEKRRLQGGTEFTDKGERHSHPVDLELDSLDIDQFDGATRGANMGPDHTHNFSFSMRDDALPQVGLADALRAARLVDQYLRSGKLTQDQLLCLDTIDGDEQYIDAKLSAAQRKKLKKSTFCGPNRSFPVPDCAHATAARRLIGRAKLSSDAKARVLACVSRRAKSLDCKSSDSADSDSYRMLQGENSTMNDKTTSPADEPKVDKTEVDAKDSRKDLEALKPEALLDKAVELMELVDSRGDQIVDLNDSKKTLKDANAALEDTNKKVTDENAELREQLHKGKARELVTMRLVTGDLAADADVDAEVEKLAERSTESLEDAISDARPLFERALKDTPRDRSSFLKDTVDGKSPVNANGEPVNSKDKNGLKDAASDKKPVEDRKAQAKNSL